MTSLRISYAPLGSLDRELMCHVSHGGMLCGVTTWAFGGGPYNAPLLTWLFCPGKKDELKMMHLTPSFLFGVYMTCGAERGEVFMASRRPWDDFQVACCFDSSAIRRLVVWSTEESHPINRESSPRGCIFPSASLCI